jgi:hypothetical protein
MGLHGARGAAKTPTGSRPPTVACCCAAHGCQLRSSGGGAGGQAAKDALGSDVKKNAWLQTHPKGDRSLAQGLKVRVTRAMRGRAGLGVLSLRPVTSEERSPGQEDARRCSSWGQCCPVEPTRAMAAADARSALLASCCALLRDTQGDPTYLIVTDGDIEKYGLNAVCTHLGCVVPWVNVSSCARMRFWGRACSSSSQNNSNRSSSSWCSVVACSAVGVCSGGGALPLVVGRLDIAWLVQAPPQPLEPPCQQRQRATHQRQQQQRRCLLWYATAWPASCRAGHPVHACCVSHTKLLREQSAVRSAAHSV